MPQAISGKEVNHHYLLPRSLLSGEPSWPLQDKNLSRAKRETLDVQLQMRFSEQAQGLVRPKAYLGGVATAGICPEMGKD